MLLSLRFLFRILHLALFLSFFFRITRSLPKPNQAERAKPNQKSQTKKSQKSQTKPKKPNQKKPSQPKNNTNLFFWKRKTQQKTESLIYPKIRRQMCTAPRRFSWGPGSLGGVHFFDSREFLIFFAYFREITMLNRPQRSGGTIRKPPVQDNVPPANQWICSFSFENG